MADFIIWGTEPGTCPKGCGDDIALHGELSEGCSVIRSGWCDCKWYPERTGVARILELVVAKDYLQPAVWRSLIEGEKAAGQSR